LPLGKSTISAGCLLEISRNVSSSKTYLKVNKDYYTNSSSLNLTLNSIFWCCSLDFLYTKHIM